jgi:hypothetical protein
MFAVVLPIITDPWLTSLSGVSDALVQASDVFLFDLLLHVWLPQKTLKAGFDYKCSNSDFIRACSLTTHAQLTQGTLWPQLPLLNRYTQLSDVGFELCEALSDLKSHTMLHLTRAWGAITQSCYHRKNFWPNKSKRQIICLLKQRKPTYCNIKLTLSLQQLSTMPKCIGTDRHVTTRLSTIPAAILPSEFASKGAITNKSAQFDNSSTISTF